MPAADLVEAARLKGARCRLDPQDGTAGFLTRFPTQSGFVTLTALGPGMLDASLADVDLLATGTRTPPGSWPRLDQPGTVTH